MPPPACCPYPCLMYRDPTRPLRRSVGRRVRDQSPGHVVAGMEGLVQRGGELGRQLSVACAVRDAEMAADADVRPQWSGCGAGLADPKDEPTAELATR